MRSLIILEVEHGEDTDGFQYAAECIAQNLKDNGWFLNVEITNYTVRIDLPTYFTLDK